MKENPISLKKTSSPNFSREKPRKAIKEDDFVAGIERALRRAARAARKTARMHGTPVYVVKNGKIVAEKP